MPFPAASISRSQPSRRFSVDLVVDSLPAVLVPKRLRCASLPSPHNPLAVPRKSALKRPRALSDGDLASTSEPFHIQFPSPEGNKDVLTEEVKLALSLEAELVQTTTMVAQICASVRELIPLTRRRRRVYSVSREEHRASALRRHANLPPPADWDEIPCKVHFSVPAPARPALRREDAEPAWSDFMVDPNASTYSTREISPLLFCPIS
ncbi:hypothetical protein DFH06DRAFT_1332433 [Mycena polygramma]|nr:hypothetical protein DFH06DRAFT_1332433 [Mycena polygramma]